MPHAKHKPNEQVQVDISKYLSDVTSIYKTGAATEHSYRSALQFLFSSIDEKIVALNEPKRVQCGAPDFLINRGEITIGHVEAKDLGKDLRSFKGHDAEQKKRFLKGLPNLIYTNCLDFEFYRSGELLTRISIADFLMGIQPKPDSFAALENQLKDFATQRLQNITSSEKLAEFMAGKAVLIKDILNNVLKEDKEVRTELSAQYGAFQQYLIHDITPEDFSDIYAETVAYGLFAARLHDHTLSDFSRQEALELLPKSNPFLRSLFSYIAGPDLDDRIKWIIDDLADVFQACDVRKLLENFGSLTQRNDPFLHFYETFLTKYNPAKRKARGVWYTPEPVVNFITRAVDDVLKSEFELPLGLADTSKVTIDWDTGQRALTKKGKLAKSQKNAFEKKEVHRVQILDPATGTGTFLAEVIKQIAPKVKVTAEGIWSNYIEKELIPRLHGFEILMASYAMCHMKLDMVLSELGYSPSGQPPRLSVYLTNSLEEGEPANQTLPFAQWLSNEVKQANAIKRDMPIMCIIGNPPYSGHSSNHGEWINELMTAYKQSPELRRPAQAKWLSDDYVKFIRLAEHTIEKNGEGVLGFITNHGYLDNPTFLDMRRHLMSTFDKIHVIDLHGSTKKKEISPDGKPDRNVFDIQQGVAIIIAIKRNSGAKKEPARVFHRHVWGSRPEKYAWLWASNLNDPSPVEITPPEAPWAFIPTDRKLLGRYEEGPSIPEIFAPNGRPAPGIVTTHDEFAISWSTTEAAKKIEKLLATETEGAARQIFKLCKQNQWSYDRAKKALSNGKWLEEIVAITYRPFDQRFTVYNPNVAVHLRDRVMRHMRHSDNVGLCFNRTVEQKRDFSDVFVFRGLIQHHSLSLKEVNYIAPLYLYPAADQLDQDRRINIDDKIYKKFGAISQHPEHGTADELSILDYVYGVLHCPIYRQTYNDFLKAGFPRVKWPVNAAEFWSVAEKGGRLRKLHLMEPEAVGETPFPLKGEGQAKVDKPAYDNEGRIWINKTQHFDSVPSKVWNFYIGGYQPAQKWLKDRRGRELSFEEIQHYQRILKILLETDSIMKTIDLTL